MGMPPRPDFNPPDDLASQALLQASGRRKTFVDDNLDLNTPVQSSSLAGGENSLVFQIVNRSSAGTDVALNRCDE